MDENNINAPENQEENLPENLGEKIIKVNLENQMKSAYIDYSMSVIVSRALPDVRDGLKPVQRRVLYGMKNMGITSRGAYRKSAKIVGEVMGNYHPHGDSAIYDTLARMAQWWSLRYPLVDPQGNFGSMDGDSPAAMRYTEARLEKISEEMLDDLDKDTVDFQNTFDDSSQEPTVLPTQIPGLLVNGSNGIAVGMATNMAPHNLSECVDGIIAYIDNREIDTQGLMQYIKAPDFPTAGVIYGYEGVREAFETGRGRIVLRGETHFEEHNGHDRIIATSVPYQVNKAEMIKKTADLVNDKKLEGLADIRDESDRKGIRVVYELKRDANPDVVLNKLFMMTPLQSSFNVNNVALVNGRPYTLNLKQLIEHCVAHRHEVVLRRTRFDLKKAEDRAHILEGLARAIDIVDEIIATIRACKGGTPEAKQAIMDKFGFDDPQASAIVAYRLGQLAGLEIKKIMDELDEIHERIKHFHDILQNEELQFQIIKDELLVIKEKYGDARRTQIVPAAGEFRMEDIIADDAVVITISHLGYIKRTPLTEYRVQSRGGKGSKGSATRDTDFIEHIFTATNHNHLLFFTEQGKCYKLRAFEIPEEGKNSKGRAIQNLLPLDKDNKVMAYLNVKSMSDEDYLENNYIILCTKKGIIKKTNLADYKNIRQNGIIAVNIREDDQLLEACLTSGNDEVLMAVRSGKAVRFNEQTVRPMGRTATGVKAITLGSPEDEVIGMVCIDDPQQTVLVVSEKGFGKRSDIDDYRITNRGAKGVKTLNITDKTGDLIAIKGVTDNDDLMIINKSGIVIRMEVSKLRVMGRATQGVKLIDLRGTDEIAAVTKVDHEDEPEETEVVEPVETPNPEATEASEPDGNSTEEAPENTLEH